MILYTIYPHKTKIGHGYLGVDITQHQAAIFQVGTEKYYLARVQLINVDQDGMLLSGLEDAGVDRRKRARYYYQEWQIEFDEKAKTGEVPVDDSALPTLASFAGRYPDATLGED